MNRKKSISIPLKLFAIFGLFAVLSSSLIGNNVGMVRAQDAVTPAPDGGIQPLAENGSSLYYYVDGQRVNLTPSLDWVSVKFVSADTVVQESVTGKFSNTVVSLDGAREIPHLGLKLLPLQNGLGTKTLVQGVNAMRASSASFSQVNPVYAYDGVELVVSDEFIAAFPAAMSMTEIESVNSTYGAELVKPILGQENTFVLRVTTVSALDALAMANFYQESGIALHAAPNFVRLAASNPAPSQEKPTPVGPMFTPNDNFYAGDQWYLNNTQQYGSFMTLDADIDAPEAWNITKGDSTITIAVIDEGVDLAHVDLSGNLVAGYDATGLGSSGAPSGNDAHGTAVAGIAAAVSNNTIGVAGVCQLCTIMPVRIAYGDGSGGWIYTDAWAADGITWAYTNGADVLNNSWGGGLGATVVNTAITNAVTNGRGGTGSVVLFAAGNDNLSTVSWPASQSNVIAVGALNMCDQRKTPTDNNCNGFELWGSNYGAVLDISAAGVWLTTTDITGAAGYSDVTTPTYGEDYNGFMNGTSGATPIVAGVAGLMFAVNPYMSPAQVQTILQNTADDLNTAGWDSQTGYGRVNAAAAVAEAEAPDLIITGYALVDPVTGVPLASAPAPNETFGIKAFVKNQGGSATEGVFYRSVFVNRNPMNPALFEITSPEGCLFNLNFTPPDSDLGDYFTPDNFAGLPPGATDTGTIVEVTGGLPTGNYQIYLYADPTCLVDNESIENNNSYGPIPVNVGGGGYPSGPTVIDVTIAGTLRGSYPLNPETSQVVKYTLDGGPVEISSNNGVGIIASLNQWRRPTPYGGWTGVAQSMALPVGQISNSYVIPRYNGTDPTLYNAVLMANVDTVPRTITVKIGGTQMGAYLLGPSDSRFEVYNITGGPLVVSSVAGSKIVASLYELKRAEGFGEYNGQSEMMGLPASQLSDKYLIPIYFGMWGNYLDASLAFANVDTMATTVTVKIAGVTQGSYPMQPSTSMVVRYTLDGGPVEISSSNGAKLVASLNQWRRPTPFGGWTGVAQSMALPLEKISNSYVIPRYNGTDPALYNAVLMANVDSVPRTITVKIGATVMGSYLLGPSDSRFEVYNFLGGPIVVSSDVGSKIVASLYELKRAEGFGEYNGQSEMMGLPASQLSDSYLIPIYFGMWGNYLDASLYIGVP